MAADGWRSFPDAPKIVHPPPGPRSRALLARQAELETDAVAYPGYFPIAVAEGRGSTIEDVDGNRFIDWVAGISVLNLGHRHPRLEAALRAQSERVWHALELPTEARIRFLEELIPVLPGGLAGRAKVLFTVTGADAVETAVSLAEYATGRAGVVAFSGAYHGVHGGAVNLTAGRRYRATSAFVGGRVVRVPFPDPYRSVLGADEGSAGTIRYLEHLVRDPASGVDDLAAVVVEPIQGEGGYVVPPDDFLPELRAFCDRHGLLLIADEVQSGLGRTGKFWAVDHAKVTPDIVCIAKSIGGGIPLSLVAYRADLVKELPRGFHLGTYRGNPLGLAVGVEVLRELKTTDLIARTARRGDRLIDRFRSFQADHPSIGDVRGRGFMIGIEFVDSPTRRTPWGDGAKAMRRALLQRGVLMHTAGAFDQVLRFMAPLVIEDELLERGLAAFEAALDEIDPAPERTVPAPAPPAPRSLAPRTAPVGAGGRPSPILPSGAD